jgi:drug/metabolite transporter (DMT)-like permease
VTGRWARLQVLAAAVLFSTAGAGIKVEAFDAFQVSAVRSGLAALALLVWVRGRLVWATPVAVASGAYAATVTLFVLSTKLTTAANAIFLQAAAPIHLLVLGPLVLGERFRARDLLYLAAVTVGMLLCFQGSVRALDTAPDPWTGNLLALVCSLTWAWTLVALRYIEREPATAGGGLTAVVGGNLLASAIAFPLAWPLPSASAGEWATIAYLGLFQIGLAYVCLTAAVRHVTALDVSLLLLVEPVLNPIWTWLVRGENPGRYTIAGGVMILAATAVRSVHAARGSIDRSPARRTGV